MTHNERRRWAHSNGYDYEINCGHCDGSYIAFAGKPHGSTSKMRKAYKEGNKEVRFDQIAKNNEAIKLINTWLADDTDYDEKTWSVLEKEQRMTDSFKKNAIGIIVGCIMIVVSVYWYFKYFAYEFLIGAIFGVVLLGLKDKRP